MKQMRKFEQEAIVNQIMEGVNERLDAKVEKAKKSKDYKAVEKLADVVVKLQSEREALSKNIQKQLIVLMKLLRTITNLTQMKWLG